MFNRLLPRRVAGIVSNRIQGRSIRQNGGSVLTPEKTVTITFIRPDGKERTEAKAFVGESLLRAAQRNDVELEGACEGGRFLLR